MLRVTGLGILALVVMTALLGIVRSGADTKRPTAQQAAAEAVFTKGISQYLDTAKAACGAKLSVTTDFENYDENAWLDSNSPKRSEEVRRRDLDLALTLLWGQCAAVLQEVARSCAPPVEHGKSRAPTQEVKAVGVQSVACLFAGFNPKQADDIVEDFVQRNMSFSSGGFVLRMGPEMVNIDSNAWNILHGRRARDTHARKNGDSCSGRGDCRSGVCEKAVCRACTSDAACGAGRFCSDARSGAGWCHRPSGTTESKTASDSKQESKSSCKTRGAIVKSNAECCASSKLVKGTRTCL